MKFFRLLYVLFSFVCGIQAAHKEKEIVVIQSRYLGLEGTDCTKWLDTLKVWTHGRYGDRRYGQPLEAPYVPYDSVSSCCIIKSSATDRSANVHFLQNAFGQWVGRIPGIYYWSTVAMGSIFDTFEKQPLASFAGMCADALLPNVTAVPVFIICEKNDPQISCEDAQAVYVQFNQYPRILSYLVNWDNQEAQTMFKSFFVDGKYVGPKKEADFLTLDKGLQNTIQQDGPRFLKALLEKESIVIHAHRSWRGWPKFLLQFWFPFSIVGGLCLLIFKSDRLRRILHKIFLKKSTSYRLSRL
jgi:hypothetical protein